MIKLISIYLFLNLIAIGVYGQVVPAKNESFKVDSTFFQKKQSLVLDSKWEMFWKEFIFSDQFKNKKGFPIHTLGSWNGLVFNGKTVGGKGYATYRLKIFSSEYNSESAIYIPPVETSYQCWWNGKLIAQNGVPAANAENAVPEYRPVLVPLIFKNDTNELVFHVSNYDLENGGFFQAPKIGNFEVITTSHNRLIALDLFLFGSIFFMALYHLVLYALRQKSLSALFFSLFALDVALRTIANGQETLLLFMPFISWAFFNKILYITFFVGPPLFALFLRSLYPKEVSRLFTNIYCIVNFGLAVFSIFSNSYIYSQTRFGAEIFMLIGFIFLFTYLVKAASRKQNGASVFLIGFVVFLVTIINDLLYFQEVIHTIELIPLGMFVFMFLQTYILAKRSAHAFNDNQKLTEALDFQNKNLEKIVEFRTSEIEKQKTEIIEQRDEIEAQKTDIENHRDMVLKQNQNITDSIIYARRIQNAVLPSSEILEQLLPQHFILYQPKDIVSGDFYFIKQIKNITYIAAADCTGHGVPGAFMSMLGVAILSEIVRKQEDLNTGQILDELRYQLKHSLQQTGQRGEQQDGIDIAFCAIDIETLEMSFAGAHNPVWLFRRSEEDNLFKLIELKADFQPVGIFHRENPFTEKKIQLQHGDLFYLFSDGYHSQFGGERMAPLKSKYFKEILFQICEKPMDEQLQILTSKFDEWKGENEQTDDVLVLGVKI